MKRLAFLSISAHALVSPLPAASPPPGKPIVYNHTEKAGSPYDKAVREAYTAKFTITDLPDSPEFTPPKTLAGHIPTRALDEIGRPLQGKVLLAYIVTADGHVVNPIVLKSSDERLNATALKALEEWRFEPARLGGTAIAITAAQEFSFKAPPPREVSPSISTATVYWLPPAELQELQHRSEEGDGKASYRIAQYYLMSRFDSKTGIQWMRKAAEQGYDHAQYDLGVTLWDDPQAREEAIRNFEKAELQGYAEAKEFLRRRKGKSP